MRAHHVIAAVTVVFVGGLTFLTVSATIDQGVTVGTAISLVVLALLAIGILGALSQRPPDDR